jgi:hypothetical protein
MSSNVPHVHDSPVRFDRRGRAILAVVFVCFFVDGLVPAVLHGRHVGETALGALLLIVLAAVLREPRGPRIPLGR